MSTPEGASLSWLERQLAKLFPGQIHLIREVLGDPYEPGIGTKEMGALMGWRFIAVLPLVTIPTYLHLSEKLPQSYATEAAYTGFWAWTCCAIAYFLLLSVGSFLHLKNKLSHPMAVVLSVACLVIEVSLSSFYAYLMGTSGGALQVVGTLSLLIMMNRLFLHYRFGVLSYVLACVACSFLVAARHLGVPVAPMHPSVGDPFLFGSGDLGFAFGWCTVVFMGANLATNQVHKLRAQLEVAHAKLADLNQFITESVLKRYLPPSLIQQIMAGQVSMDKPAEMKTLTILFSDLKGFTAISEKLGPQEISHLLNDYFTNMNEVIFDHGGTIDKFIGDAIMVFFGAPKSLDPRTQAEQAAACAKAMQTRMQLLSQEWEAKGAQNLSMRIGVHQGEAVVGNFGSNQRVDYTCIGPDVNLASRIESACEPGQVFISESVAQFLEARQYQEVGSFNLKGITDEQTLYRYLSDD